MTKIIRLLFAVDAGIVVFCALEGNMVWFANTQTAFVGSLAVTLGSYLGYKKLVERRAQELSGAIDEEDSLAKWDDTHQLFEENKGEQPPETQEEEGTDTPQEREKLPFWTMLKTTSSGTLSLFRIVGYGVLIGGFFALVNRQMFEPVSYFFGLAVVPFAVIVAIALEKRDSSIQNELKGEDVD